MHMPILKTNLNEKCIHEFVVINTIKYQAKRVDNGNINDTLYIHINIV